MGLFQEIFEQFRQKDTKVVDKATDDRKASEKSIIEKSSRMRSKKHINEFL